MSVTSTRQLSTRPSTGVVVFSDKKKITRPKPAIAISDAEAIAHVTQFLTHRLAELGRTVAGSRTVVKQQAASLEFHYWDTCRAQLERLAQSLPAGGGQ